MVEFLEQACSQNNFKSLLKVGPDYEQNYNKIIDLTKELTKEYDVSHDITHHIKVFNNAMKILIGTKNIMVDYDKQMLPRESDIINMIMYASLTHDIIDTKYPTNMEYKITKLKKFLLEQVPFKATTVESVVPFRATVAESAMPTLHEEIFWIISNVSYKKESKIENIKHSDYVVQFVRDIVSDADKLESLGEIGIERCRLYIKIFQPDIPESEHTKLIVEHCHHKLLKLMPKYMKTLLGIAMAEPLHQYILNYVKLHDTSNIV